MKSSLSEGLGRLENMKVRERVWLHNGTAPASTGTDEDGYWCPLPRDVLWSRIDIVHFYAVRLIVLLIHGARTGRPHNCYNADLPDSQTEYAFGA